MHTFSSKFETSFVLPKLCFLLIETVNDRALFKLRKLPFMIRLNQLFSAASNFKLPIYRNAKAHGLI